MARHGGHPSYVEQRVASMPAPMLLLLTGLAVAVTFASTLDRTGSAADEPATPNVVVTGSPVPCGVPASSWGSATASDVRIQIRAVAHDVRFEGTPTPAPAGSATVVALEIANLGDSVVRIEANDVTIRTCGGQELHPVTRADVSSLALGSFSPDESNVGTLAFLVPAGDQAQSITIGIQEKERTGARVECDLVVALDNEGEVADVAVGCSAFGGDAKPGGDATGDKATAPPDYDD
ncbi:MAG: DUF4352 domain-containing protein [Thermomicrobiales bacterium]